MPAPFSLEGIISTKGKNEEEVWGPSPAELSTASILPPQFKDIPFAPFSKTEKIGRIADWNTTDSRGGPTFDSHSQSGAGGRSGGQSRGGGSSTTRRGDANAFAYVHADDEASFSVVDNTRAPTNRRGGPSLGGMNRGGAAGGRGGLGRPGAPGGRQGGRLPPNAQAARGGARGGRGGPGASMRGGARGGGRPGFRDWDKPQRVREGSVAVGADWQQIEEIDFVRLGKLRLDVNLDDVQDLSSHGTLHEYDRSYDRISSVRFEKPLTVQDRVRYNPTTSDDPIISEIASQPRPAAKAVEEGAAPPADAIQIFMTDAILSLLLCTTRSIYPWDIIITIEDGNKIYFDKRDGGAFDYVTVNENAADPPMEIAEANKDDPKGVQAAANVNPINTPSALSLEATYVSQNFAFQVVNEKKQIKMPDGPNPFYSEAEETDPLASCGYRYRRFDLSSDDSEPVHLIVRTEVDAVMPAASKSAPRSYITIKTLNEFDSRAQGAGGAPDWRAKLDAQRGAVIATEMKNNSSKLARFAVQAILAGADNMKMGYISRATPRDASRHVILGTQWYKPREFAAQMNLNLSNGWGIVRTIADLVRNAGKPKPKKAATTDGEEGGEEEEEEEIIPADDVKGPKKYVLIKDPNKPLIRLYSVPLSWPASLEDNDDLLEDEALPSGVRGE